MTRQSNTDGSSGTDGLEEQREWMQAKKKPVTVEFCGPFADPVVVETLEGDFEVDEEYVEEHGGFVLIRGVQGEVYPCALDIFHETYVTTGRPAETHQIWNEWGEKAEANIEKWGMQDLDTLILAATEELGELTQAYLEARAEDGDPQRIREEIDDLGALLIQLIYRHEVDHAE